MLFTKPVITIKPILRARCNDSSDKAPPALRKLRNSCRFYTISQPRSSLWCDCAYESKHNHTNIGSTSFGFEGDAPTWGRPLWTRSALLRVRWDYQSNPSHASHGGLREDGHQRES